MEYLFIYLIIGLILVLWDFRKTLKSALWKIRFSKVDEYAATLAYGPKPKIDSWNLPKYVRDKNYLVAVLFIIFWPIKICLKI
jgi:hypothetical protein